MKTYEAIKTMKIDELERLIFGWVEPYIEDDVLKVMARKSIRAFLETDLRA